MGLNEFLAVYQSRIAAGFKKHALFKLVSSQVLAFLLGLKLYLLLQQAKVNAFQVSVPCQMNRFPQKHPQCCQQVGVCWSLLLFILNKVNLSRKTNLIHLFICLFLCLCGAIISCDMCICVVCFLMCVCLFPTLREPQNV